MRRIVSSLVACTLAWASISVWNRVVDGSAVPAAHASVKGTQCAAEDKAKRAKKALDYAIALYTAATAMCGIACAQPQTTAFTGTSCTALTFGAMGYDIYSSISISKDPSGLMGLVFGLGSGGLITSTKATYGLLTAESAPAASAGADTAKEGATSGEKAEKEDNGYCPTAIMDGIQALMKVMAATSAKNAQKEAKAECEAEAQGGTQLTLGGSAPSSGSDATSTITPLGTPGGERGQQAASGSDDCGSGIPKALKTFENCATAADPSLSKFFTPEFTQDFKNVLGTDLGTFARAQGEGGFGDRLANGLAAAGKAGPDTAENARAFEAYLAKEIQKSPGSMYAGGGSTGGRKGNDDRTNPKQLMKDLMAAMGLTKDEEEKKRRADALVFGATREPATDLSPRRDVSLFDRVARRYRESHERITGP